MTNLRSKIIHLAHKKPEFRSALLPILAKEARVEEAFDAVVQFVRNGLSPRTWMDVRVDGDRVELDTREHGSIYDEAAGQEDVDEGKRVTRELRKKFPKANVEFGVTDEWVSISVDFKGKRYRSSELAAALVSAFPQAGDIQRLGGTDESALAIVPGIGSVRLTSGFLQRPGGTMAQVTVLDREDSLFRIPLSTAIEVKDLKPSTLRRSVSKAPPSNR